MLSATKIPTLSQRHLITCGWLVALAIITGLVTIWWMHPLVNSFTIQPFGDQAWIQAQAQAAIQVGPFGTTTHAGWSSGFNPWQYPTGTSVGFLSLAWVLGMVGVGSSNALVAIMAITAASVAVATALAVRLAAPARVHPAISWLLGLTFGLSPYVLSKMGHYNVAAFTLVPAVLAYIGWQLSHHHRRAHVLAGIVLAIISLLSPLWWILVVCYLLVLGLLVAAVLRSRTWLAHTARALGWTVLGALVPVILVWVNRVPDGTWNRQPWDSTLYGGSLTDFLLASPLLRSLVPALEDLLPGTSRELSSIGLIPSLTALAAIVFAITAYLGFDSATRKRSGWLFVGLQLTLLSFLSLGLGTFQEAVLLLVGVESPLRGWSRLIMLVSLLGAVLAAPIVSRPLLSAGRHRSGFAVVALGVVVLAVTIGDVRSIVHMDPRGLPTIEERAAVEQLSVLAPDCPVAQLPVGSFPDYPMADGSPTALSYYYRGFVPYLLNPEGTWSFGAVKGSASDHALRSLPPTLTGPVLMQLRQAGYCAVLYDTHYAQWMRAKNLKWPAQDIVGLTPAWQDDRFAVFSLRQS